jgi:hypothetical protein
MNADTIPCSGIVSSRLSVRELLEDVRDRMIRIERSIIEVRQWADGKILDIVPRIEKLESAVETLRPCIAANEQTGCPLVGE